MNIEQIKKQRSELIEKLKQGTITVKFNKLNGEFREMTCTLQESLLPEPAKVQSKQNNKEPKPETLSVWDVNAKGWRAFRIEKIIEVTR